VRWKYIFAYSENLFDSGHRNFVGGLKIIVLCRLPNKSFPLLFTLYHRSDSKYRIAIAERQAL
jgi:hypothetical protein